MTEFRIVPDIVRNREPVKRGRKPSGVSKKLLQERTVFIPTTEKKTWGNLYRLAKSHGLQAKVRWEDDYFGEQGYTIWFIDKDTN